MSSRKYSFNAFETTLASGISAGADDMELVSVVNLRAPGYLVLEDDSASKREYIDFSNINGSTLEGCNRGLDGSAAGGVAHDAGIVVRGVMMHQFIDDIFDDIDGLETDVSGFTSDLSTAEADISSLQANEFTAAQHAATDHGPIVAVVFPTGTRMVFDQDTAPTGWTRDTSTSNDRMIRIVTGSRGPHGGTWDQSDHVHSVGSHAHTLNSHTHVMGDHSHSVSNHTHTGPSHTHSISGHSHSGGTTAASGTTAIGAEGSGSSFEYTIKSHVHTQGTTTSQSGGTVTAAGGTGSTSSSGPGSTQSAGSSTSTAGPSTANTGSSSGSTGGSKTDTGWRPSYRDMIVAVKD